MIHGCRLEGLHRRTVRCIIATGILALLGSCGGGGGGSSSASFFVSTNSLSFSASGPQDQTPAGQTITASVTGEVSGTLYILVTISGQAVANVSNVSLSGSSGQGTVTVKPPSALGIGTFSGTVMIRACINSSTCASGELSGSPRTVNVSYSIAGPPLADAVMPHVITAGISGSVVLRGNDFSGVTGVSFGGTPASAFTIVSSSLIEATYPSSLAPGAHSISLAGASFSGSVVAVGLQAYSATTLSYPEAPARIASALYDAERRALYIAAAFDTVANSKLWRYRFTNGAWVAPEVISVPSLRDIALSSDGSKLYVLTTTAIEERDAASPGAGATRTVPAAFTGQIQGQPFLSRFAVLNNGNLFVTAGRVGVQSTHSSYLYATEAGTFADLGSSTAMPSSPEGIGAGLVSSANGRLAIATQAGTSNIASVLKYHADNGLVEVTAFSLSQFPNDQSVSLDNRGNKIAVTNGSSGTAIWSESASLGRIDTTGFGLVRVVVVNPQGTRAYVLTNGQNNGPYLMSFNIAIAATGTPPSFSSAVPAAPQAVPALHSQLLRTAVTPDGATLFIAGDARVEVIPAP